MRAVLQRATEASVTVAGAIVAALPRPGLVVFVGVHRDDTPARARTLATKVHTLRILAGERSAADLDAPLLVVSQFTLYADTGKGRRPSWQPAAPAAVAEPLVAAFVVALRKAGAHVQTGVFGAHMVVGLVNDGPVTLLVEA